LSNGDGSEVTLTGDARVLRAATLSATGKEQPAMSFNGEYLHAFINTELLHSDQPAILTRGQDRFTADRMDYDNKQRLVLLEGRVKGLLIPGVKH
jgi:lipopolysaccharide export system protein LptC